MSFKIKPNKIGKLKNMQQSRLTSVEVSVHIGRYERSHRPIRTLTPFEVRRLCLILCLIYVSRVVIFSKNKSFILHANIDVNQIKKIYLHENGG